MWIRWTGLATCDEYDRRNLQGGGGGTGIDIMVGIFDVRDYKKKEDTINEPHISLKILRDIIFLCQISLKEWVV